MSTSLNRVQDQTTAHRDEINSLKNRQCTGAHTTCEENREVIDFQNYRRNPMLFLERVEEKIAKTGEDRWSVIRSMLDEMFRKVYDNWWMAMRPNIHNFQEFKKQFKSKYWSDAVSYTHLDVYKRQVCCCVNVYFKFLLY